MSDWNGVPQKDGWHWLNRQRDGAMRMGHYRRTDGFWRVADEIGRTNIADGSKVAKRFTYVCEVQQPTCDQP